MYRIAKVSIPRYIMIRYRAEVPACFNIIFMTNNKTYNYNTCFGNNMRTPNLNTNIVKQTLKLTGTNVCNEILLEIRNSLSINTFKIHYSYISVVYLAQ